MTTALARYQSRIPARSYDCDRALEKLTACATLDELVNTLPGLRTYRMAQIEEACVMAYYNELRDSFDKISVSGSHPGPLLAPSGGVKSIAPPAGSNANTDGAPRAQAVEMSRLSEPLKGASSVSGGK